jgi:hypothetical protein
VKVANGPNVGWINRLSNDTTDGTIVVAESWQLLWVRVGRVDDVFDPGGPKMHVEYPDPLKVVGVWSRRFQLLDSIQKFESWVAS